MNRFSNIEPSNAGLMRLEIELRGLPGDIVDITTSPSKDMYKELKSPHKDRLDIQFHVFTAADERAVREGIGVPSDRSGTFLPQHREFLTLREKYVYVVPGFGKFIKADDISSFEADVKDLNARFSALRMCVMGILETRYPHRQVEYHQHILRFNPRVKYGVFLLTQSYVQNEEFIRCCRRKAYRGVGIYNKEDITYCLRRNGVMIDEDNNNLMRQKNSL